MTMDTNVLKAEDKSEVYRLTDLVVREVSIVDRPANLRPFLLMKSEGSQGAELEPDGKGGFRVKAATPSMETNDAVTPEVGMRVIIRNPHMPGHSRGVITAVDAGPAVEILADGESTPHRWYVPREVVAEASGSEQMTMAKSIEIDDSIFAAANVQVSEVEKVGRKLAAKREQAIRQAIELLLSVIDDATKSVDSLSAANKSLSSQLAAERASLQGLRGEHETLKAQHVKLVRSVSKARGNVQKSNALSMDERGDAGRVVWPRDMNES